MYTPLPITCHISTLFNTALDIYPISFLSSDRLPINKQLPSRFNPYPILPDIIIFTHPKFNSSLSLPSFPPHTTTFVHVTPLLPSSHCYILPFAQSPLQLLLNLFHQTSQCFPTSIFLIIFSLIFAYSSPPFTHSHIPNTHSLIPISISLFILHL